MLAILEHPAPCGLALTFFCNKGTLLFSLRGGPGRRCRAPWRLQTRSGRPVRAVRRRPWSMLATARANRTDGEAVAGAAEAEKCKKARVTLPVLSVLQTVLQHAAEALADKTKELTDVLGSINNDQLVAEPDVWLQHRPQRTSPGALIRQFRICEFPTRKPERADDESRNPRHELES